MENKYQSLVGPVVIGAELGREDHESTIQSPATATGMRLKSLDARTDPQTKLRGLVDRILVVKKMENK
jgi:hypothetical protein